jgi:DNA ligase (NAD+)
LEVGIKTARDLSKNFENIDDLIHARYRRLNQIVDIGDVITRNILEFFANDNNIAEIQRLFDAGVEIIYPEKKPQIETIFTGKKVVITGKIEGYSREGMSDKIMELGGNVASSVSPKTDFLIVGADPGSKLAKAKSFGVRIIEEKELKEILKQY